MDALRARTAAARIAAILAAGALAGGCDGDGEFVFDPDPPDAPPWEWTELGAPPGATPELVGNHEPLVVAGADLLLGTADGVWRRSLAAHGEWQHSGLEGRTIHALAKTADGARIVAAGFDPRDERAPTVWYSLTGGLDWTAAASWPRGAPGNADAGVSYRFASLEPDPHDPSVVYGGLAGDTLAVTTDGGATWLLANGETMPVIGDPCVAHRPGAAAVLLQGCELPLDVAWVGARDVDEDDRLTLAGFRFLYGYPELSELGNRRVNALVAPRGRDDRVLVGVEGGLLELTSASGEWRERADIEARAVYWSDGSRAAGPYTYVRAIAPLGADGRHVLFGGTVNGVNEVLSLFETADDGGDVRRIEPPFPFEDPRVEQAVMLSADDVLLVISDTENGGERRPWVYRLRRP